MKHWDGAWENYEIWNLYHQMFLKQPRKKTNSLRNDINITNPAEGGLLEAPSSPTFLNVKCPSMF